MAHSRHRAFLVWLIAFAATVANAQTSVRMAETRGRAVRRILARVDDNSLQALPGQVHPLARPEFDRGAVSGDYPMQRMVLMLQPTPQQDAALQNLLTALHDPSSPQFHQWLTPEQFGEQFGADPQDIAAIRDWLGTHGFTVESVGRGRRSIEFSGTAAQVRAAFRTEIHQFEVNGEVHVANATDPVIPAALAPVVRGFVSLHNFRRRPLHIARTNVAAPSPQFNTSGGSHILSPYDFATIYNVLPLWKSGIDGTGQSIAIIARTDIWDSDISLFRSDFGLASSGKFVRLVNGPNPGVLSTNGDQVESSADVEWSGAVAKGATIDLVISKSTNTADGIDLSSMYAVDNNVAPIISLSYGGCEAWMQGNTLYAQLWQQAAARGISVVVSAGDNGSAGCDDPWKKTLAGGGLAVNGLASTPDNLAVGGTAFNEAGNDANYWNPTNDANNASALGYIPETSWNESYNDSTGISILAGSGGVSTVYATPVWQTGNGVPGSDPDGSGKHHRYLPDVSLSASGHDAYFVCAQQSCKYSTPLSGYAVAGTSLSAPSFAGLLALVNQQTNSIQGNPNFHLYPLSKTAGVYHDITSGTIEVPCAAGSPSCGSNGVMTGYATGPGYDLATGWGSVDANALVTKWSSVQFQPVTITGSASATSFVHGTTVQLSANVSAANGTPAGGVSAYVVSGSGVTTQLGAATVAGGAISLSTNAIPGGTQTLYFRYSGDGVYGSAISAGIPMTVTLEPTTLTIMPPSGTQTATGIIPITLVASGASGVGHPTGAFQLTHGTDSLYSGGLFVLNASGAFTATVAFAPRTPGTYTLTVTYGGDGNFAPASASFDVTFAPFTATDFLRCTNGTKDVVAGTAVQCLDSVYSMGPWAISPSGTLQLYDLGNPVGAAVAAGANVALPVPNLAVGSHQFSVKYSGDSNYVPFTDTQLPFTVVPTGTINVGGSATADGAVVGTTVNIAISAQPNQFGPALAGTFDLFDGSTKISSSPGWPNGAWALQVIFNVNTASAPLSPGTHAFTVKYANDASWQSASTTPFVVYVASGPDFVIETNGTINIKQGGSMSQGIALHGFGGLSGAATVSCGGAPIEATCSIAPASTTIGSAVTLSISTMSPHVAQASPAFPWSAVVFAAGFLWLPFGLRGKLKYVALLLAVVCVMGVIGCGGGVNTAKSSNSAGAGSGTGGTLDPGTPPGTYTLQITATYGSGATAITHTYPLQLTVQ